MTKTSTKPAVVLFLTALILVSACSHLKESNQSSTPPKAGGDCAKADDSSLTANVKTEFSKKLRNKVPEAITLNTKAGVVTLTGKINYEPTKKYAAEIAKGVKCVKDVVNNIEITSAPGCPSGELWCCCEDGACDCQHVRVCPICLPKVAKK
jgi:osmotically-inducible protein OsmY